MTGVISASKRGTWAALIGAAALGLNVGSAEAIGLKDSLFRRLPGANRTAPGPRVAHYLSEDGDSFVLDRTQPQPLMKFDDNPEVWVLSPQPAPRGDVIYKNDMGAPMLRATRLGGVTLFSDSQPNGEAVSLVGEGAPLRLPLITLQALGERLLHASLRTGRLPGRGGRGVVFQAEASPASTALMGDAATLVTLALLRLAERPDGRAQLGQVAKVQLVEGKRPAATLRGGVLMVTVAPSQGLAGRPSSERIMKAVAGR